MSPQNTIQNRYDTFICYRGENQSNGIGKIIGQQIFELIKDRKCEFGNVFFAPNEAQYNFIEDAEPIIKNVKKMIVVLCPDFFEGFEKDGKPNPESSTYHELLAAFKYPSCKFFPVFVYGFDFSKPENQNLLNKYYGEFGINRLIHMSGVRIDSNVFSEADVAKLTDVLTPKSNIDDIDLSDFIEQIDCCSETIVNTKIHLDVNSLETDHYTYLYYNIEKKRFFPKRFLEELKSISEKCALPHADFYYWPVDLIKNTESDDIHICAVCFGIMLLHNWLQKDKMFAARNANICNEVVERYKAIVCGATNLLISLRSLNLKSWPAVWEFDKKGIEGTINQTTLSLSTLLSCDFLAFENPYGSISKEIFVNRYNFISESITWLIEAKYPYKKFGLDGLPQYSWGYMASNTISALLPTTFAFDTLLKFKTCLIDALPIFEADEEYSEFTALLNERIGEIQNVLTGIIRHFEREIKESGAFLCPNANETSITHTAKVLKSLVTYVRKTPECEQNMDSISLARRLINRSFVFLAKVEFERIINLTENEVFEQFEYSANTQTAKTQTGYEFDRNEGENYENSGELLYVDALINAMAFFDNIEDTNYNAIFNKILKIMKELKKRICIHPYFSYIGRRSSYPQNPIYCLYYYRMACYDIIKYATKWGKKND